MTIGPSLPAFAPTARNPMTSDFTLWLRGLAAKGGRGVVNNIDARSLGRIADELERRTYLAEDDLKMQCRFTHHALVELYKLCRTLGNFKNGVEHNGIDEGEVYASGVFDRVEAVLRGKYP